jgi:predicted aconitase
MSMQLTDDEKAMHDGRDGAAVAKAMDLLIRYGNALGAADFVETRNVCGTVTATTPFMRDFAMAKGGFDAVFSEFNLDTADVVEVPQVRAKSFHLQLGFDPNHPKEMGVSEETVQFYRRSEAVVARMGVNMINTCTPYQVGNVPSFGEHCAWMESSAVVYANSVLGARTNTEGRESTSAAMLTCRIPRWGLHLDENRRGQVGVKIECTPQSNEDWGLLGYWMGHWVQNQVAVLDGVQHQPDLASLKHFGAAASSSGGVELYHLVGVTPEAPSWAQAFGGNPEGEVRIYDAQARAQTLDKLNGQTQNTQVDYVMLGCPHYNLAQMQRALELLNGRRISAQSALWLFTPHDVKSQADAQGLTAALEQAGVKILTNSCSAMSRAVPPGTRVVALDSAKQAHYLPAILGVQAWFGTTAQCIDAACTGVWSHA